MVRTRLIPESNRMIVTIPDNYVGKNVEVIVFAADDMQELQLHQKGNISKYKGSLSKKKADDLNRFAVQIRKEWSRDT
ncbi:MAG: hypothetical protein H0V14_11320 [Chitinophagaceae bacterium]|nr:hypothetical protein [Chitinophagaceae bacterium]